MEGRTHMKKLILIVTMVAVLLTQAACTSSTAKKAIEQSKLSMANSDYTAALNYLQLAQSEGSDDDEINEMILILENYIKAKEEFDEINMDGAAEALNAIPDSYKNYTIAEDIESLKHDVETKRAVISDVDQQIASVKEWLAAGDYERASANITELYSKDITNYQRKQIDELKSMLDSAQSKIDDAANKQPEVVYVPQTSSNTNVVATYYVVNCKQSITLRTAPSTSASEIVQIPLGQAVGYIENAGNGFYKINYDGKVGYSLASYLSSTKPGTSTASSNSSGRVAQVVNCKEWITLRSNPSTSGDSLAQIPLGTYVTFVSTADNGFYCIEYKGQRGYALQSYIALR